MAGENQLAKPGYKQPSREGRVSILVWMDEEVRTALKIAALEKGVTVQDVMETAAKNYAADTLKRLKKK
jgi:hypothetical protein